MPIYKKEKKTTGKLRSITVPKVHVPVILPLTFVGKLKKRLKAAFQFFEAKKEHTLTGRIQELNSHAADINKTLENLKKNFSPGGIYDASQDPELHVFVEAILDPLLREAGQLYQGLHSISIPEQAKAFKKFGLWLERAKDWVHFFDKKRTKQEIIEGVVQHLVGEALTRIDRDIEVVKQYLYHQVVSLYVSPERQKELQKKIEVAVNAQLQNLTALKKRPQKITLEGLGFWKNQIDHYRQTFFDLALHTIDAAVEHESPGAYSGEANEHLQEVISMTTHLEWEVEELLKEVQEGYLDDPVERNILHAHLLALSEEAHALMLDLRLGWELLTRLQKVSSDIATALALLSEKYPD